MLDRDLDNLRGICKDRTESILTHMSEGFDSAIKKYNDIESANDFPGEARSNSVDVLFLDRVSTLGHLASN